MNAFRGLSHCNLLDLSNSLIETIENFTFFAVKNINYLNLSNCRIRYISNDSFKEMHRIKKINLEGNYLININENTYLELIMNFLNSSAINENKNNQIFINFDRNPIKCDCDLIWLLNNKTFLNYVKLPEICSGPKGYDCLKISKFFSIMNNQNLSACSVNTSSVQKLPCDESQIINKNADNEDEGEENITNNEETSTSTAVATSKMTTKAAIHITSKSSTVQQKTTTTPTINLNKNKLVSTKSSNNRNRISLHMLVTILSSLFILKLIDSC